MTKGRAKPNAVGAGSRRKMLNKLSGMDVAFDLREENPTEVKYWIPTGATWLDGIIARGIMAGIPGCKVTEIAGLEATGKSYLAVQIAANAQKMGMFVVYADPEAGISPTFLERAGVDMSEESFLYLQPHSLENWYAIMEALLNERGENERFLFILDSLAQIPCEADNSGDYNPNGTVGVKARVQSLAMKKLQVPLAQSESTYLILNQLKDNITGMSKVPNPKYATDNQRYITPGGKAATYSASLRIWLTGSQSKKLIVEDEMGYRIGSYVKARLEKSRFGTQGRICEFKILWGEDIGVLDEESILEAIKTSDEITLGAWNRFNGSDGYEKKWQKGAQGFTELMNTDEEFRNRVMEVFKRDVVMAFENKTVDAGKFYDPSPDELKKLDEAAREAAKEIDIGNRE